MSDGVNGGNGQIGGRVGIPAARGRLFRKYVMLFLAVVSVALLTNGLFDFWFFYRQHTESLIRIQREQAEAAADKISQFIREIEAQLGWTTQLPWTASTLEQRRIDALRLLRQVPAITELSQLDPSGHEQVRVSRLARDVIGSNVDFSEDPKFRDAVANRIYYGPVYFRAESEPYMTLALAGPLRQAGVSVAEVNLKFIWDVVSQIKVGIRGHAYVVDARDRLIAHPNMDLVLRKTDLSGLAQVRAAHRGESGNDAESLEVATNIEGHRVLTANAPVAPLGWRVFVELPVDEAYAPLYTTIGRTSLVLLAALGLAFLAGMVLARRMVIPIQTLRAGAARIGGGDLAQRISIRTGDELEMLADQFNDMASRLHESYSDLEKKVEARTREIEEKNRQLEIASKHKTQFLANMSHELRTPLNAILGYTELILDQIYGEMPDRMRSVLERVQINGRHLLGLINDVLDLAKIEAGQLTLSIVDYSLPEVVHGVFTAVEPLAREKRLALKVDVPAQLPRGRGDERRINQVLLNLVGNAIKFTDAGEVAIRACAANGSFTVAVQDTGPGIAEIDQGKIFDEFQQVDNSSTRKKTGSGLGLSISKHIVEMHGGRIWVESKLGAGAVFSFTIPVRVERQAEQS